MIVTHMYHHSSPASSPESIQDQVKNSLQKNIRTTFGDVNNSRPLWDSWDVETIFRYKYIYYIVKSLQFIDLEPSTYIELRTIWSIDVLLTIL